MKSQSRNINAEQAIRSILLDVRGYSGVGRIEENEDDLGYWIYGTSWKESEVIMYVQVFQTEKGDTEFTFYDDYDGEFLFQSIL